MGVQIKIAAPHTVASLLHQDFFYLFPVTILTKLAYINLNFFTKILKFNILPNDNMQNCQYLGNAQP